MNPVSCGAHGGANALDSNNSHTHTHATITTYRLLAATLVPMWPFALVRLCSWWPDTRIRPDNRRWRCQWPNAIHVHAPSTMHRNSICKTGKRKTFENGCEVNRFESFFFGCQMRGMVDGDPYLWTHLNVGGGFPSPTHSNAAGLYNGAVVRRSGPADKIRGGSVCGRGGVVARWL